ncbi:MAG: triose-phosphate isomerase, partial [Pseudomonadota bacterium]
MRKLAAGNWKMNGLTAALAEVEALTAGLPATPPEVLICPPATLIAQMVAQAGGKIAVGGQDCHTAETGAHTGDISAAMLADAGARYVILGHSERRADHGETDDLVRAKAETAWAAGLCTIICIGESEAQYREKATLDVVSAQVSGSVPDGATAANTVIAYEPIWAIGTGLVPQMDEIATVHGAIRAQLSGRFGSDIAGNLRLLYGGS